MTLKQSTFKVMRAFGRWIWTLAKSLWLATGYAKDVLFTKKTLLRWALKAHKAQIIFALSLVLGIFAIEPVAIFVSDFVHPPKWQKWKKKYGPRKRASRELERSLETIYWTSAGGVVFILLWLELPIVAAWHAEQRKRKRASQPPVSAPGEQLSVPGEKLSAPDEEPSLDSTAPLTPVELKAPSEFKDSSIPTLSAEDQVVNALVAKVRRTKGPLIPGGRYEIESEIGSGGMGVVYKARDNVLNRVVALKALPPGFVRNEILVKRFREEARVVAGLQHPNIVQVFDMIEDNDTLYMAMEFVQGSDLAAHIKRRGPLELHDVLRMAMTLTEAMAYAHEMGVIHRDLKPQNVLINEDNLAKITDFGLAKGKESPDLTQAGAILGSPNYVSPEQAAGNPTDARTDIYALGCTVFEMMAGRPPFVGEMVEVLMKQMTEEPPLLKDLVADVPQELSNLIAKMLAKDPDDRFATMREVLSELEGFERRS